MSVLSQIQNYFKSNCDEIANEHVKSYTLPFLDPYGELMRLYIFTNKDHLLISDDGSTFENLFNEHGIEIDEKLWHEIQKHLADVQYRCDGSPVADYGNHNNLTVELIREVPLDAADSEISDNLISLANEINLVYQRWFSILEQQKSVS